MKSVKDIVELLSNYSWDYSDLGYTSEAPIIVLAPNIENGEYTDISGRSTELRVCCCSGDFMTLPYDKPQETYDLLSGDYGWFAVGESQNGIYKNGQNKENIIPASFYVTYIDLFNNMKNKTIQANSKDVENWFKEVSFESEENYKKALDFAILAATNRFRKKNPKDGLRQERWIQEIILKKYIKSVLNKDSVLFFDEETLFNFFDIRTRTKADGTFFSVEDGKPMESSSCRPDLVVFDGKSFGLIELKYNADSMDKDSANSLRDHYLDFQYLIETMKSIVIKEYIRRFWFLFKMNIIDSSWKESFTTYRIDYEFWDMSYEEMIECLNTIAVDDIEIWSALLFVNDGSKRALTARKKSILKNIKEQLGDILPDNNVDIRYQIFEGEAKEYVPDFANLNELIQTL